MRPKTPLLTIDVVCLVPEAVSAFFSQGLLLRAQESNLLKINVHNLRQWSKDKRRNVDDKPYGGGAGMILKVEPLVASLLAIKRATLIKPYVVFTSPAGSKFDQKKAQLLSQKKHLLIYCGRYEGVDQRFLDKYVDEQISIGDYVLGSGEAASIVLVEAISRLIPGFLGNRQSLEEESFTERLLEYPQYTRPENFRGLKVPPILLSGDHQKIATWRKKKALAKTRRDRPDLIKP